MRKEPLKVFIGFDSKESIAYHVLAHSIMSRASEPVWLAPLYQPQLRSMGVYTRERGPRESTEFSMTRFLVPYLSGYRGHSVFMDSDMLCLADINELWPLIEAQMDFYEPFWKRRDDGKAVLCCQHDYDVVEGSTKFLGQVQSAYPRKNWSSFMVFDNRRCRALTPEYVNTATGLELHRFKWLDDTGGDERIGALPLEWNWLVGEYVPTPAPKVLHWTLGGPYFEEYRTADYADLWFAERDAALGAGAAV